MVLTETAEPVDLPFGLWTRVGRRKHKFNRIRQVAPTCPHGRAHWRHLANTIEPSACGGHVVLLVHGQVTIIFVVSVCLFVCLSVCLCRVFLSHLWSDFKQTWTYVIRL